jgi:hypothetical protein
MNRREKATPDEDEKEKANEYPVPSRRNGRL